MANRILTQDEVEQEIYKPLAEALQKLWDALPPGQSVRIGMFEFKKDPPEDVPLAR